MTEDLPDTVICQERAYRLEVRADIEEGLADVAAGRVMTSAELLREFGLPE